MINPSRQASTVGRPATSAAGPSALTLTTGLAQAQIGATQGQANGAKSFPLAARFRIGRFTIKALADVYSECKGGAYTFCCCVRMKSPCLHSRRQEG